MRRLIIEVRGPSDRLDTLMDVLEDAARRGELPAGGVVDVRATGRGAVDATVRLYERGVQGVRDEAERSGA